MAPGRGRQVLRVGHSGLGLPHRRAPAEAGVPSELSLQVPGEGSSLWTPDSQLWGGVVHSSGRPLLHPLQVWDCAPPASPRGPWRS